MPDYSEFPTTPTAWQAIHELPVEDPPPPPPRRGVDLVALVPGLVFSVLAILLMSGVDLPLGFLRDGGILWAVLIGGGVVLLVKELRRRR